MVLHIARALDALWVEVALELGEDLPVRLAHDVGQQVQATTMRSAEDDLTRRCLGRGIDERIEDYHG